MTRPFIPFPIFPPYSHWYPNREDELPANLQVAARLNDIDPECQPFTSLWFANHYINWVAHSWNRDTPHLQYQSCIHALEKMLSWSFANGRSLLNWTREDFEQYARFIINPSRDWVISSVQQRFLAAPDLDYKDWPINPAWRLFQGGRGIDSAGGQDLAYSRGKGDKPDKLRELEELAKQAVDSGTPLPTTTQEIDQNIWKREIRRVKLFLDFYLKDVKANRPNVAAAKLDFLALKAPKPLAVISDIELRWIIQELPNLLSTHERHIFEMYLIIGRYTNQPMHIVIGTTVNPGRIDQFSRRSDGRWLGYHATQERYAPVSLEFDETFRNYLHYLNIDEKSPLPATALFPSKDQMSAYDRKKLWVITSRVREQLADVARAANDPAISAAADKFRELTLKVVANRHC